MTAPTGEGDRVNLTIAIDFDDTFGADPATFREAVKAFQAAGHQCILITNRPEDMGNDVRAEVGDLMPIVFAGEWSKRAMAAQSGYRVDIWIDDHPQWIDEDGLTYIGKDRP